MKTAQIAFRKVIVSTIITAALVFPKGTWAAAGAKVACNSGSSCTIGEFLYDDTYTPIASASCTLTSYYPSGSLFLDNTVMATGSGGWYSYSFTSPTTTGYYHTQVCCTAGEDYLCLDKSFEVVTEPTAPPSTSEIAEAVWGYSSRTMSSFGTLAADIWGYSSRSLTSLGTLAADVWSYATRTLTGTGLSSGNLATKSDVDSQATNTSSTVATMSSQISSINNKVEALQKSNLSTQELLEQLVNKPIVQNSIEEVPDLGAKIGETKTTAEMLFMNSQYVISRVGLLQLKWKTLSDGEILENVVGLGNVLGEETDSSSSGSIFGEIAWLKNSWNWSLVEEIFDQTKAIKASLTSVETKLEAEGKSTTVKQELADLNFYLATLEKLIGDSTDLSGQKTLFGKLRETRELASVFDSRETEVNELLANWNGNESKDTQDKIDTLFKKVIAVNRIPQASSAFTPRGEESPLAKQLKNKLLGLRALIAANRLLLAKGTNDPFVNTWLEEGSMVFKSLVTNPSKTISQKVTLKYYLPAEVKKEDIIEIDPGLTVSFDAEKGQYFVEGEFNLRPGETRTVAVRVADIWVISEDEVNALRKQAEELSRPLEKTAYFAQGVTLKSDIDVSLDKILVLQKGKVTPEEKIRAYREAQIEMNAVKTKIDKLQELVTQAGSNNNLLGFVGGSQTMAVWGLIIILLAGFVFLTIYMRIVVNHNHNHNNNALEVTKEKKEGEEKKSSKSQPQGKLKSFSVIKTALVFLGFGVLSAAISGFIVWKLTLASVTKERPLLAQQTSAVKGLSTEEPAKEEKKVEEAPKEELIKIEVPDGGVVNIRKEPKLSAQILMQLKSSQEAQKLEVLDKWVKVSFPAKEDVQAPLVGWVSAAFVSSK